MAAAQTTLSLQKSIGLRVRALRRARGLTQEVLAEKLGMLTPNYARVEQGRLNVTLDTLVRIANALDVEVASLLKKATSNERSRVGRPRQVKTVASRR